MNILTGVKQQLPQLPSVPNGGRGRLEVDIPYQAPDTVETRLGSIPSGYRTSSRGGPSGTTSFEEGNKEAANRYGSSDEVWRAQPTYNADGSAKLKAATEHLVAEPKSKVTTPLLWGLGGALGGGLAGAVVGLIGNFHPGIGVAVGAGVAALATGTLGYRNAAQDRVKLEWQETNIVEYNLTGYHHSISEITKEECSGFGKDRRCRTVNDGYRHRFSAVTDDKVVGTYFQPMVVHYNEKT